MLAYQKLMDLIMEYLDKEKNSHTSDKFCTNYMDMYFELSDELSTELTQKQFEVFDDLNLLCDSYENNPQIRRADKFCIDENHLKEKVLIYFNIINSNFSQS